MKWTNKRSRIVDALESNAHENKLESMISNLSLLNSDEFSKVKNRLLFLALKNASKECAEFLLSKESKFNSIDILRKCDWTKMVEVFNLLKLHEDKDDYKSIQKAYLINRLVDPSKVDANKERVDFLFKLISDGFFTAEQVRDQIEENYKGKPEKKGSFIAIYRELTLKELGI